MGYQAKQFVFNASAVGRGNVLANQVNQFLALNPGVSPVAMSTSWREGRSKATQATATLIFRLGGASTRWWAFEMAGAANTEPEDQLAYFLANNPTFIPTIILQVGSQGSANRWRRLLVITADSSFAQLGATNRGLPATPSADVAEAAFGTYWDKVDATRPPTAALNMGNGTWPLGGVNFLVPALGNNPDMNLLGGIAPPCQTDAFTPPADPTIVDLCDGCFPDDVHATTTVTATGTTTSTSSTTSTSTTSTSTSSTSTSSTSSSTSSSSTSTSSTSSTTTSASCPAPTSGGAEFMVAHDDSVVVGPFPGKPPAAGAACCYQIDITVHVTWPTSVDPGNGGAWTFVDEVFKVSCETIFSVGVNGSIIDPSPYHYTTTVFTCDPTEFRVGVVNYFHDVSLSCIFSWTITAVGSTCP